MRLAHHVGERGWPQAIGQGTRLRRRRPGGSGGKQTVLGVVGHPVLSTARMLGGLDASFRPHSAAILQGSMQRLVIVKRLIQV
jgi:hypothetical protein